LFKSYPKSDYDDPDNALAQMLEVLNGYSLAIVEEVTRPATGLQRTCKFPPRIAEIVEACDAAAARVARFSRYANWGQRQLEAPSGPKPTPEEFAARYGTSNGLPEGFGEDNGVARGFTTGQALPFSDVAKLYRAEPERMTNLTAELGRRRSLRFR
jgi:hypothetical protein